MYRATRSTSLEPLLTARGLTTFIIPLPTGVFHGFFPLYCGKLVALGLLHVMLEKAIEVGRDFPSPLGVKLHAYDPSVRRTL